MRFPFIGRAHHEDVVKMLNAQIAERDQRLATLDHDHKRLLDSIFKTNFGTQVYGMLPEQMTAEPELTETELEKRDREFAESHQQDVAEMKAAWRTSPSTVPHLLARIKERDLAARLHPAKVTG